MEEFLLLGLGCLLLMICKWESCFLVEGFVGFFIWLIWVYFFFGVVRIFFEEGEGFLDNVYISSFVVMRVKVMK